MKEINDKFDKAETYVERLSKLILKIVTTLAALIMGIVFAWNQLKATLNQHVHQEDEQFQEYLKEVETEEEYNSEEINIVKEDSLYRVFYHLDEELIADSMVNDTLIIDTPFINPTVIDSIITDSSSVDTTLVDTLITDTTITDTIEVIE